MVEVLAVLGLAALAAVLVWGWRRLSRAAEPGPRRTAWGGDEDRGGTRIVLDIESSDPDDPAVQRLVQEAAHRVLARDRDLVEVEVVARDGTVLGVEHRPEPLPADVELPPALRTPHAPARHTPSPVPQSDPGHPRYVAEPAPEVRATPLAERLDLAPAIRSRIADPDRALDVLRAILEASDRPVEVDGDLLVTGDVAVAVVDPRGDTERALNHAFLRIQGTDVARGMIVRLGYVDPTLTRRREAAAPHVRHVGADAIQRMADAVAAGADPIAFAAGPVTVG
ncbi:hypothetical protein [Nitriliruptor alkaliphilus]|uniref:hypothetical protein n=1 Tax=Nitriliruptor alkaliphilus TaxID=427918 RepID=UPI000697E4F3|nr:hypothetical protein [Nitriliruptor alkaliphilus]